jgi:hypothetical protein
MRRYNEGENMSNYTGWAIKLINNNFAHDGKNDVTPALFPTRRAAQAWWNENKATTPGGSVVRVSVAVKGIS